MLKLHISFFKSDTFRFVGFTICCFRYHKGTDFQANHNNTVDKLKTVTVVLDTTKVQIFKQITTCERTWYYHV